MRIGAMNNPQKPILEEFRWMGALNLEFVDLTLEPPSAASWMVSPKEIAQAAKDHGLLPIVGHTAYYLPLASPFLSLRRAAVDELKRAVDAFAEMGVRWMNVHPDRWAPLHPRSFYIQANLESLAELCDHGRQCQVAIMLENLPGEFNSAEQLGELLDPMPELGLHLDIGHANLMTRKNTTPELLAAYGPRLAHVHLHDNKGGRSDLHLPLGVGTMDWKKFVSLLKESGYDDTITLEVFSEDRSFLAISRDLLREAWSSA